MWRQKRGSECSNQRRGQVGTESSRIIKEVNLWDMATAWLEGVGTDVRRNSLN